ncbi:hypothetical protein NDU88_001194 [Pleurodeles waltl]|uniref:Uncharacterized protein n=1 Tax=Pleurodeles waltl TaxID=8319 RepID=A0AAV7SZF6_PLEWA|nr:hypothetical protein NDU88_001194 [Pleurodeles waltl]
MESESPAGTGGLETRCGLVDAGGTSGLREQRMLKKLDWNLGTVERTQRGFVLSTQARKSGGLQPEITI